MALRPQSLGRSKQKGPAPNGTEEMKTQTVSHLLGTLQMALRELDAEVKTEEQGKEELRRHLQKLQTEHTELRKARDRAARTVEAFEVGSQSFEKEYSRLMDNSHTTYNFVRAKHKDAINILKKDDAFGYHPAYKTKDSPFQGAYFTPQPLKRAEEKKNPAAQKIEKMRKQGSLAQVGGAVATSSSATS
ncbi:unnamed protein product [Polarella glacialis]|uniref:Uncharacterized protein n=1 Tax=Polarella glacialis TaxID=89957 RepID=A0A813JLV6_POLGL|nr:unnamed protein product [Polarella glacialis]CAE8678371.1 unnamed protein product [Polarella glacialis]|mmetsp:Transcript_15460/g.27422  ORF Transcript_15460/g.27422 Transcript_15460/m.27422 type:complete len:189 (-) Transcript_15460:162-728(-)